jgi:hypothetical protein
MAGSSRDFSTSRFKAIYNGKQLFEVEDSTFRDAGKVGLGQRLTA